MECEKQYYPRYNEDVREALGLLLRYLMNMRPGRFLKKQVGFDCFNSSPSFVKLASVGASLEEKNTVKEHDL
nr:hypothetical protein CFP56_59990 [Quercus suber]